MFAQYIANVVQRRSQPRLAYREGCAAGTLAVQEARRGDERDGSEKSEILVVFTIRVEFHQVVKIPVLIILARQHHSRHKTAIRIWPQLQRCIFVTINVRLAVPALI